MEKNAALEGMVGHVVGVPSKCDKPVTWVMCGDGLWEIRRNSIGVFRRCAAEAAIPGLSSGLVEGFELTVPKIPLSLLWQAVAFFRQVYGLHQSEAAVRAVYNRKTKRYFLDCPPQEVSAARCNFDRHQSFSDGIVVAEIHSHGRLQAGFSGTDDKDELADRFYGIVGRVEDFFPQTCFRLAIGGNHLDVDICDLFDTAGDPMQGARFPTAWLDQVKKRETVRPPRFCGSRRFLDDLDDPENRDFLLPNWDHYDPDDDDESTEARLWDASEDDEQAILEAEEQERWHEKPRNRR